MKRIIYILVIFLFFADGFSQNFGSGELLIQNKSGQTSGHEIIIKIFPAAGKLTKGLTFNLS